MLRKLRKFWAASREEQWLLTQMLVLLPLTRLGVLVVGVGRWQQLLARLAALPKFSSNGKENAAPHMAGNSELRDHVRLIARMMRVARTHAPIRSNCLQQSLVLWYLLRRHDIASEIRYGARREESQLKAHAWVECLGFALNEPSNGDLNYVPFEPVNNTAQAFAERVHT